MYRWIVARQLRKTFAHLNDGDWQYMVDGLAPEFSYRFYGDHELAGDRRSREAIGEWGRRIFQLLPGLNFIVEDVLVAGPPWNTRVAARPSVSARLPSGGRYQNVAFQFVRLRLGKVTEIATLEDTQELARSLELARAGLR